MPESVCIAHQCKSQLKHNSRSADCCLCGAGKVLVSVVDLPGQIVNDDYMQLRLDLDDELRMITSRGVSRKPGDTRSAN